MRLWIQAPAHGFRAHLLSRALLPRALRMLMAVTGYTGVFLSVRVPSGADLTCNPFPPRISIQC